MSGLKGRLTDRFSAVVIYKCPPRFPSYTYEFTFATRLMVLSWFLFVRFVQYRSYMQTPTTPLYLGGTSPYWRSVCLLPERSFPPRPSLRTHTLWYYIVSIFLCITESLRSPTGPSHCDSRDDVWTLMVPGICPIPRTSEVGGQGSGRVCISGFTCKLWSCFIEFRHENWSGYDWLNTFYTGLRRWCL